MDFGRVGQGIFALDRIPVKLGNDVNVDVP
jgi:hypothetical protein